MLTPQFNMFSGVLPRLMAVTPQFYTLLGPPVLAITNSLNQRVIFLSWRIACLHLPQPFRIQYFVIIKCSFEYIAYTFPSDHICTQFSLVDRLSGLRWPSHGQTEQQVGWSFGWPIGLDEYRVSNQLIVRRTESDRRKLYPNPCSACCWKRDFVMADHHQPYSLSAIFDSFGSWFKVFIMFEHNLCIQPCTSTAYSFDMSYIPDVCRRSVCNAVWIELWI